MRLRYLILFITLSILILLFLDYEKSVKINEYLDEKTERYQNAYSVIYSQHKELADTFFRTLIDDETLISIYKDINKNINHNNKLNILRDRLYSHLLENYKKIQLNNVNTLNFHTIDNKSFLRMQHPEKFADDLKDIREMVRYVNTNHKAIDGFEIGRLQQGFRFIYPIKDMVSNKHLGSVEISFSARSFTSKLMNQYNVESRFFSLENILNKKLLEPYRTHYLKTPFDGYSIDERTLEPSSASRLKSRMPEQSFIQNVQTSMSNNKAVTLYTSKAKLVVSFIPITNPVSDQVVAFISIISPEQYILNIIKNFYIINIISILLLLMTSLFIYKQQKTKYQIKEKEHLLQNILDTTKHLTFITDFVDIGFANKAFLKYFNFKSIEEFHENYSEFSDLLLQKDGYINDSLRQKGESFVDMLNRTPESKRKAILLSPKIDLEAFSISMETIVFKEKVFYLVTLMEITKLELERIQAEEKANYDELTGIYNRNKLKEMFDIEVKKVKRFKHPLSMAMLDIDHFKILNDTYGHLIGDEVLIMLSKLIKENLRETDTVARWGGEEFVVIFSETNINNAAIALKNLQNKINSIKHESAGNITVSFGLTQYKSDDTMHTILQRCDTALYQAKNNGRNRIETA